MKIDEQKLLDLFLQLIRIDSISLNDRAMADFLIHKFKGWDVEVTDDDAAAKIGGNSGNLIIRLDSNSNHSSPLVLLAHTDTVRSTAGVKPIIEKGVIRSDGSTILGADVHFLAPFLGMGLFGFHRINPGSHHAIFFLAPFLQRVICRLFSMMFFLVVDITNDLLQISAPKRNDAISSPPIKRFWVF